ncbi:MAG: ZIP family metal transporter [Candidatus Paceibacterota bacterium]
MFFEAIFAAAAVALCSLIGALFFGNSRKLEGVERYVIPTAVGVFLSLVLFELIPETLEANATWGGVAVAVGFILFYILSYELHRYFHTKEDDDKLCQRKGAATLLLIGDSVHNITDGVILGAAFLINPALGAAVAVGLALHEIPQEIVEFGVLVRGGYSRLKAALLNLLSASSIIVGTALTLILADHAAEYVWIITGIAAGNLLFIAASDLLPRIHGNLKTYGSFWATLLALVLGFIMMTFVLIYTHETFGHGHAHDEELHDDEIDHLHEDEHHDEHDDEHEHELEIDAH